MTTNLTTRSAQADTIPAVPPRRVPQRTQTAWFTRLLLPALLASFTIPLAHAQVTYTYTGNNFNVIGTLWTTSDRVTATLTTPVPFPSIPLFSVCPVGTTFTITAGGVTLRSSDPSNGTNCSVETDTQGNILYWFVSIETSGYYIQTEWFGPTGLDQAVTGDNTSQGFIHNQPGTWAPPTAQNITTALLGLLSGGSFTLDKLQRTILIDLLTPELTLLNHGNDKLACLDLSLLADYVKFQTGKVQLGRPINPTDAATIRQWLGWIAAAIPGGCKIR